MLTRALYLLILAAWCGGVWAVTGTFRAGNTPGAGRPFATDGPSYITTESGVRQTRRDVAFSDFFEQHILASLPRNETLDFPMRLPDGDGVFISTHFQENGSAGEDWNTAMGDGDIGEPVYATGDGMVTLAQDFEAAWGKVVIIAMRLPEDTMPRGSGRAGIPPTPAPGTATNAGTTASLTPPTGTPVPAAVEVMYSHLDTMAVQPMQMVKRGDKIGTVGNANGLYKAHLHWEVRRVVGLGLASSLDPMAPDTIWLPPTPTILRYRGESAAPPKMRKVPPTERLEWGSTAPSSSVR
ncbi:hypothetical protein DB346_07375 [Verrucomicrobia bacterium LW23]|nr:hypothetical protein DB346_07375 [Verrucomicrobia bacterium LW23]